MRCTASRCRSPASLRSSASASAIGSPPNPPRVRALSWAATLLGLAAAAGLPAQRAGPADPSLPPVTLLYQNFPNPFPALGQDATCLSFDLAIAAEVQLDILDLSG